MIFDLHTHTSASDGVLSPQELVNQAQLANVAVLAITDHDTLAGYQQASSLEPGTMQLVPGIELSAQWHKTGVHVVGLNVDPNSDSLRQIIATQQRTRRARAVTIAERLAKRGLGNLFEQASQVAELGNIGRPHFAHVLVTNGVVRTFSEAFNKYLGNGKIGDVPCTWLPLDDIVQGIRDAGGVAVLAHPDKYAVTHSKLVRLIDDFLQAGGQALEVISGRQTASRTRELGALCSQKGLHASCGSDFHKPGQSWADLGRHGLLPDNCRPVWDIW